MLPQQSCTLDTIASLTCLLCSSHSASLLKPSCIRILTFLESTNSRFDFFRKREPFLIKSKHIFKIDMRNLWPETTFFALLASVLLLLAPAKIHLRLLNPIDNAYFWRRSSVVGILLMVYGIVFLVLAIFSYRSSSKGISLTKRVLRYCREAAALLRTSLFPAIRRSFSAESIPWLFVVLGIGIALRAYFLAQPMRYDESYTFLNYINGDFTRLFYYPLPNNHVLHTIFVKLSTLIWGAHPESIRFPAFLAGTASIPLIFCVCRVLLRGKSGLFASMAVALFPYLVLYSTTARGYSMIVFLSLALMLAGAHFSRTPSTIVSIILSSIAALGLMTIPIMAFPIASIYLWLFYAYLLNGSTLRRILRAFVIPSAIMTVGFSAILYSPVVFVSNGLQSLLFNEFVQSQPSEMFVSQIDPHFAETLADYFRDIPEAFLLFCGILVVLGVYSAAIQRNWVILLLLPAMFVASVVLFLFKHGIPYPRTWIYIIPFVLIVADMGWTYCVEKLTRRFQKVAINGMVFAGIFYGVSLISTNAIARYHDTGNFPEARVVARFLESVMTEDDAVDGIVPADYPTYFYLWYDQMGDIRPRRNHDWRDKFYVVKKSRYSIEEMTKDKVVKLFEIEDAAVYKSLKESKQPVSATDPMPEG
jgi:hypothetical protein